MKMGIFLCYAEDTMMFAVELKIIGKEKWY